jgi:hypothetical protein
MKTPAPAKNLFAQLTVSVNRLPLGSPQCRAKMGPKKLQRALLPTGLLRLPDLSPVRQRRLTTPASGPGYSDYLALWRRDYLQSSPRSLLLQATPR